jgi:hypothetical protein
MCTVSRFQPDEVKAALAKVRRACSSFPETSERLSHGGPAFFVRDKKCFLMFLDDHHDDGRLAIWCAAPDGVQAEMVDTDPERFFRPPYVGHLGWLGFSCQALIRPNSTRSVERLLSLWRLKRW